MMSVFVLVPSFDRRVIALDKTPSETRIRDVMTPNPPVVDIDESAMDAVSRMLQNKTRHLPVSSRPAVRRFKFMLRLYFSL